VRIDFLRRTRLARNFVARDTRFRRGAVNRIDALHHPNDGANRFGVELSLPRWRCVSPQNRHGQSNAAVRHLSVEDPPDLWHVEWTPYAEYFRNSPDAKPWVVMAHNVESLIWRRYCA
jgi:hypothetical protein